MHFLTTDQISLTAKRCCLHFCRGCYNSGMNAQQPASGPKPKSVGWMLLWFGVIQFLLGVLFLPETDRPSFGWPYISILIVTMATSALCFAATPNSEQQNTTTQLLLTCMLAGFLVMLAGPCLYQMSDALDNERTAIHYRRLTHTLLPIGAAVAACSAVGIYWHDRRFRT